MAALSFKQFFFAWMRRAFTQSLGPIDLWAGLLAAALGVIDHYWPAGQLMSSLGWQVPVFALAAVMVVRLLLAPYWMAKDDAAKIARLEARNSVPDIKIESISRAQIFEKQPNEKTDGGIFIVFSMCKV